jgi:hypothetical protein
LTEESSKESNLWLVLSAPSVSIHIWLLENILNRRVLVNEVLLDLFLEFGDLSCLSLGCSLGLSGELGSDLVLSFLPLSLASSLDHILVLLDLVSMPLASCIKVVVDKRGWVLFVSIESVELILGCGHKPWHDISLQDVLLELILEVTHISE